MSQSANKAYIAFGANLPFEGNTPACTLLSAVSDLKDRGVHVLAFSRLWQSRAWPDPAQPSYVNAMAEVATSLPPFALLQSLHRIERKYGRQRTIRNAPRTLDLDIIAYGDLCLRTQHLTLPHPRLAMRAFVLFPLCDLVPHWKMPGSGQSLLSLINALPDDEKRTVIPLKRR